MIRTNYAARFMCGLFAVMTLAACETRVGDLTFVSTRNIDLSDAHLDIKTGKRVSGEDCRVNPLGIRLFGLPNLKDAIDEALTVGGGNLMVDQVTRVRGEWWLIATRSCYVIEGTVINASLKK